MANLNRVHSIEDLKKIAERRIPSVMFDYLQGGSEDEISLDWNRNAYNKYEFVPRILKNVTNIDLSTKVQGVDLKIPIINAPIGMAKMFNHMGEIAAVRAAHKAGAAYTLSTVATTSIENVNAEADGPLFFQIYAWKNKKMINDFIERCEKQNYAGIMLAVDFPTLGKREKDLHNGHGNPKIQKINTALSAITKPNWLYNFITKPKWQMANMINHLPHKAMAIKVVEDINSQFRTDVTWEDAKEIMRKWDGKFMLKGIQSVEDAIKASEMGVSGIILSNHGGRQLDGAPSSLDLLPEVIKAVGSDVEIIIDGGIQRGADIIKAIALGAKAVLIGKAYLYGLAAGGEAGVEKSYEILVDEMTRVMRLIGCNSLSELNPTYVKKHL